MIRFCSTEKLFQVISRGKSFEFTVYIVICDYLHMRELALKNWVSWQSAGSGLLC